MLTSGTANNSFEREATQSACETLTCTYIRDVVVTTGLTFNCEALTRVLRRLIGESPKRSQSLRNMVSLKLDTETQQPTYSLRRAIITVVVVIGIIFSYTRLAHSPNKMAAHSAAGWHARATELANPGDFKPSRSALAFALLLSAPADPEGFSTAFFHPNIAVDARGKVLELTPADFDELSLVVGQIDSLPKAGGFRNQWRVHHERTSYPIDRIVVSKDKQEELEETGVYGWSAETRALDKPVEQYKELPDCLQTSIGLLREARTGYVRGGEDREILRKVLDVINGV